MEKILSVKDASLHYFTSKGAVRALDGVSFDLDKGETLGLVGESGCGKTTTGAALLNMPSPPGRMVGGEITIDGFKTLAMSERDLRSKVRWEKISMVFQGAMNCLTPVYTVGKQMLETLQEHRDMPKAQAMTIIEENLALVGLPPETVRKYPHELSGGMKQRIVIATALFLRPKVVILDEPTTALDVIVQAQIINLLKQLKRTFDLSFIFITHDLATEAEVADRILVMYAGKVAELGTNQQIFGEAGPAHPYTQKLLAATPRISKKVESLAFIPGTPPDLVDPPKGCRFAPRCHVRFEKCSEEPPLREIEKDHSVACWRCY